MKQIATVYKRSFIIFAVVIFSFIGYGFADTYFELTRNLDIFSTLFREVNIYYVDSVDSDKLMKKGIDAMLESLDPYTSFIPESEKDDYRFMTTGLYGGIGAVIRSKGDSIAINEPYEGFPAQKAGLRAGDILLEVDGVSLKGKKTDEVSRMLKGQPNTQVTVLIQREGEKHPFTKVLTREEIKIKTIPYFGLLEPGIGYIKLTGFTDGASKELSKALADLKKQTELKGVILDLRNNPGGLLNEAVNISNLFVEKGQEIVSTRGKMKEWNKSYKAINDPVDTSLPLIVLVNSGSASASEIVSGSLQDLDRAVIIGQRTFGKGLVQATRPLSYNAQLKVTTSKYYIPSGRCIQAVDYTHRNPDGSVGKIPDSLISEFSTQAGRKVYDGGGILPDIQVKSEPLSSISASLYSKNLIFDYATHYRNTHDSINETGIFQLTDLDYDHFSHFLSDKEYQYTTTSEKELDNLRKSATSENTIDKIKPELDALSKKIAELKKEDLARNKTEIMNELEEEIVSRYYFQAGRIQSSLTHDPEIKKAIDLLKNQKMYHSILNGSYRPVEEAKSQAR
jgi:carboxyl-terminal processing protease